MTPSRPPRLATWLLKNFGCSENNEAVIGDLAERYSRGGRALWYWRQVIVAVVVSAIQNIYNHKLLTLRDLALGWGVLWIAGGTLTRFLWAVTEQWSPASFYPTVNSWKPLWTYAEFAYVFQQALGMGIALLTPFLSGIIVGWIVARVHHPHDRSLLLLLNATYMFETIGPLSRWVAWTTTILLVVGVLLGGRLKGYPKPLTEVA